MGVVIKGSRGQGFKGSSEMLKNYKELNVWQKSYELCLKIYRPKLIGSGFWVLGSKVITS